MSVPIHQFPCLSDNFGALIHDPETGATATIDAPDAQAVITAVEANGWQLTHVLVTHHHADHTQGLPALRERYHGLRVVGPAAEQGKIGPLDEALKEGDTTRVGSLAAKVIETPGHTAGHIVYWFEGEGVLFAGDTLFAMGCGRVFETPMDVMFASLGKLSRLPDETQVYCGHEYTQSNARFALKVDPGNARLKQRAAEVDALRSAGKPTLPTTLELERATNPFLRAGDPEVKQAVGMADADPGAVFAELRERKNRA